MLAPPSSRHIIAQLSRCHSPLSSQTAFSSCNLNTYHTLLPTVCFNIEKCIMVLHCFKSFRSCPLDHYFNPYCLLSSGNRELITTLWMYHMVWHFCCAILFAWDTPDSTTHLYLATHSLAYSSEMLICVCISVLFFWILMLNSLVLSPASYTIWLCSSKANAIDVCLFPVAEPSL